ncbi:MAG: glycoside hydrolase family 127 protein, partial [Firmicutes bacterium]|nr:glycoside hydrolase family 127 protein [Bacillota bacterium]
WLDGFIPLAYLLEDEDLIARAQRYIDAILDRQQDDGWICPCSVDERSTYDLWAYFLICKVLALYCQLTGSSRAETALYRAMKHLSTMEFTLFDWGKSRWFEALIPLLYLKERYHEEWIPQLGLELRRQGLDWPSLTERWKTPINQWTHETHIVNLGMMLKTEAMTSALLDEPYTGIPEKLWKVLEKYNGTPAGIFTGDECLSGRSPIQGTELCHVVELMYSCQWLYSVTGDRIWADRLEKAAFNALPATFTDDMWTHQYVQMSNQIACQEFPGRSLFRTNNSQAHLFGLEPHFGCCTANFNQGWPKLAMNAFLHSEKGLLCALMLPATLHTTWNDVPVTVTMETEYPFRLSCKYTVTVDAPVQMELKIRIPGWAKEAASGDYIIDKTWSGTESFTLELTDTPHLKSTTHGLRTAEYGPMIFSLPIQAQYISREYEKNGVERRFPYCDYELIPQTPWNYGFAGTELTVTEKTGDDIPFSSVHPRLTLQASLSPIRWGYEDGFLTVASKYPQSKKALAEPTTMELIPYGCAKLRMTEMPMVSK